MRERSGIAARPWRYVRVAPRVGTLPSNKEAGPPKEEPASLVRGPKVERPCGRGGSDLDGCRGSHLVVAGAAIDRAIVARREGDHRLLAALRADGCVVLAWRSELAVALRDLATVQTALRVVLEALAGEELLLTGGEKELLPTVPARQSAIFVQSLSLHAAGDAVAPMAGSGTAIDLRRGRRGRSTRGAAARGMRSCSSSRISLVARLYPSAQDPFNTGFGVAPRYGSGA